MKHLKKIFALLMVLSMVLAMGTTAFAAEGAPGSITIENAIVGNTYGVYRIFDLNSHNEDYSALNYTINPAWEGFFATGAAGGEYIVLDQVSDDLTYVTWKEGADVAQFAVEAIAYAEANGISPVDEKTAQDDIVKFDSLELGYYLVKSSVGAVCSLDTTKPDVTILEKNSAPTLKKEVLENDPDNTLHNGEGYGKYNDAEIGQKVTFRITIEVIDGKPFEYVVHDSMAPGLVPDEDSIKIYRTDNTGTHQMAFTSDYTTAIDDTGSGHAITITFTDLDDNSDGVMDHSVLNPNDVIVITYTATVTDDARIGANGSYDADDGNRNQAFLAYGKEDADGNKEETKVSSTTTYVLKMDFLKYTMESNQEVYLKDAKFALYKVDESDPNLKYYAIFDSNNKLTGWTTSLPIDDDIPAEAGTFTSGADGKVEISGLDVGEYFLEETQAPDGYNKLSKPVPVEIERGHTKDNESNDAPEYVVTYGETSASGQRASGTVKVENKTGSLLPETGGIGTTIFYVLGGILVVASGVVFVTKKRMKNKEN